MNNVDLTISIEEFDIKDYNEVYELWKLVFPRNTDASYSRDKVEFFLKRNPGTSFVARADNQIVGAVLAGNDGRRGYIHHLGILGNYRGYRIGTMLLRKVEEAFGKLGMDKIHLLVFKDNGKAKEFYDIAGYSKRDDVDLYSRVIR